jgi:hypothetical protein
MPDESRVLSEKPTPRWPQNHDGTPVVPAEWLGRASGNQNGAFFMDAWTRRKNGKDDPPGSRCILCGFVCEDQHTVFVVPMEFARFSQYPPPDDDYMAFAHLACSHTMYRGRYDALRQMVEQGVPHDEMLERIKCWPWTPEEVEQGVI